MSSALVGGLYCEVDGEKVDCEDIFSLINIFQFSQAEDITGEFSVFVDEGLVLIN